MKLLIIDDYLQYRTCDKLTEDDRLYLNDGVIEVIKCVDNEYYTLGNDGEWYKIEEL